MALTGFNVLFSYMYRKYISHIHPPLPSLFTSSLLLESSLKHDLFYIPVLCCLRVYSLFSGVLPWYFIWKYIVLWPSIALPYPCSLTLYRTTVFSAFCSYTDVMYFNIIQSL
jgi:hypothetical protein